MALTEAEDIMKQWQEYTEELYKKDLHNPDNHANVITNPEPDILEYEVKGALGSITTNKASGGDGITPELCKIIKDDAIKVLHSICQQIWKAQQWPQDWKRSVFIPIPKKYNAKECSHYSMIAFISHASKVMLGEIMGTVKESLKKSVKVTLAETSRRVWKKQPRLPSSQPSQCPKAGRSLAGPLPSKPSPRAWSLSRRLTRASWDKPGPTTGLSSPGKGRSSMERNSRKRKCWRATRRR